MSYSKYFEEPPPIWGTANHKFDKQTFKRQAFFVFATIVVLLGAIYFPQLRNHLLQNPSGSFVPQDEMRSQITSFSFNNDENKFFVMGDITLPKGTVLAYELLPLQIGEKQIPQVARSAFVMQEDNKFSISIPAKFKENHENYLVKVAFSPEWQTASWPTAIVLGENMENFKGPEVQIRGDKKQLVTSGVVYKRQYFQ